MSADRRPLQLQVWWAEHEVITQTRSTGSLQTGLMMAIDSPTRCTSDSNYQHLYHHIQNSRCISGFISVSEIQCVCSSFENADKGHECFQQEEESRSQRAGRAVRFLLQTLLRRRRGPVWLGQRHDAVWALQVRLEGLLICGLQRLEKMFCLPAVVTVKAPVAPTGWKKREEAV